MPQKPGRNDPCWCGSGKKYKNCHLREDESAHARQAMRHRLTERLSEFALTGRLKKDFESAIPFFFGKGFSIDDIADDSQKIYYLSRALEFFIHDYPLPNGQRVIERFIAEQGKRLSPEEGALLNDWLHSFPAVYEVTEVRRGEGMRLRDLLTDEEFDVREVRGTEQVSRWDLLFTRVLWTRDHYEMGGGGMHLPSRFRGWLRSHVEDLRHKYQTNHPNASYEDFLHASAQLINQFISNEIEPVLRQPPTLVTMEGDLTEFCTATFDVLDYPLTLAGLRTAEEFHEVEEKEKTDVLAFAWHEVGESLALLRAHGPAFEYKKVQSPQPGALRVLGHLTLTADELKLEVTSRRRLAAGTELLAKRVGSAIQHREDEIKPLQMEPGRPKAAVDETAEIEEELPAEVEAWQAEMMAQYHREWLDQNVPALDGKTPREAVKTLGGRVRVIRLLKEFEERESMKARRGEIAYDLDELKTELGLTDQDFLDESRLEDRLKDELEDIEELAHEDRLDEALAAWRAFRQKYPIATERDFEFAEVWDLAGVMYETILELTNRLAMFKRFDEGIAVLEEYIAIEPEHADECRANIAEMRMERGETERGLRELEELAQRVPENHNVVTTLAFAQRDLLNRPDDAIATLQRARAYAEEDWCARNLCDEILQTYCDAQRLDEAEQFWHTENDPLEEEEKDYLGWTKIMIARGDLARARESASKIDRETARTYWTGMVESLAGNFDAAREAWGDGLKEPPFNMWADCAEWTELHLRLRDADPVIRKVDPAKLKHSSAYFSLALAYALKGDLKRAEKLARAGRAEMERRERRIYFALALREVRELADALQLPDAARQALGIGGE